VRLGFFARRYFLRNTKYRLASIVSAQTDPVPVRECPALPGWPLSEIRLR
jgi:hypothetical protein